MRVNNNIDFIDRLCKQNYIIISYQAQCMETIDNLPFSGNVADDMTRTTIIIASPVSLFGPHVLHSPPSPLTRVQSNTAPGLVVYGKFSHVVSVITEKK